MSTIAEELHNLLGHAAGPDVPVRLRAWDGSEAGPDGAPVLELRSPAAIRRMVWRPAELGAAQAYVTGEIDVVEGSGWTLQTALTRLFDHVHKFDRPRRLTPSLLWRGVRAAQRVRAFGRPPAAPASQAVLRGRLHTRTRDRGAVSHHYDLSNEFYALILDPSMAYSCGYHAWPSTSLADAQQAKLALICHKLGLDSEQTLLDVGCGWGSLSLHAAENFGARVVGVTISAEQKRFIDARVEERGLAERVEIRLQDYRDVPERDHFDAVASIEMGEHVGAQNYPEYAQALRRAVRPGGRVLVQQMSRTGRHPGGGPFIESFIAPDMHMRPIGETVALLESAGLEFRDVHALREHYVLTVNGWIERFEANRVKLTELVGEEVMRVWKLYLVGGALAFRDGRMGVDQILLTRPGAPHGLPMVRVR
jgi:cyclopropane-fatty-acyl-phospholipid synthase